MKPLKFRVWNPFDKEYLIDELELYLLPSGDIRCGGRKLCSEDYIIEYSTGLLDKNGKEIYEGDILAWAIKYSRKEKYIIRREGSQFYMEDIKTKNTFALFSMNRHEVIGKINQNPGATR